MMEIHSNMNCESANSSSFALQFQPDRRQTSGNVENCADKTRGILHRKCGTPVNRDKTRRRFAGFQAAEAIRSQTFVEVGQIGSQKNTSVVRPKTGFNFYKSLPERNLQHEQLRPARGLHLEWPPDDSLRQLADWPTWASVAKH